MSYEVSYSSEEHKEESVGYFVSAYIKEVSGKRWRGGELREYWESLHLSGGRGAAEDVLEWLAQKLRDIPEDRRGSASIEIESDNLGQRLTIRDYV